jgi:hypothetical protein
MHAVPIPGKFFIERLPIQKIRDENIAAIACLLSRCFSEKAIQGCLDYISKLLQIEIEDISARESISTISILLQESNPTKAILTARKELCETTDSIDKQFSVTDHVLLIQVCFWKRLINSCLRFYAIVCPYEK